MTVATENEIKSYLFNRSEMTPREREILDYTQNQKILHLEPSEKTLKALEKIENRIENKYVKKEDCSNKEQLCMAANIKPLMKEVAELKHNAARFEQKVDDKFVKLDDKQDQILLAISKQPELLAIKFADKDVVTKMERNINWIVKLVIATIVVAIIGIALKR
jgi:phage shock protein A